MHRTYGSKKAVSGGLDPREMLFTMDDKSSVFDALYIQNIKKTKRELSCMGSSSHQGVASSKVRKRKYVKRLVKEVERSIRESVSESVFLTPDRSIRVNRAPDPFDLLLNSSPACPEPKQAGKDDLFDQLRLEMPSKTYSRKKIPPKKKVNYSNSDFTESDTENSMEKDTNRTQNTTDIRAHKLLIEKEHTPSPKIDESINKIVKNLSLLKSLNRQSSMGSVKKDFRYNKNRLTKNNNTPTLQSSPLSSTPFTEKIRSKSIYKFSPIPMGDLEDSPTIGDNNESVVFVPKTSFKKKLSESRVSPVTHFENKYDKNKTNGNKLVFCERDTPECSKNSPIASFVEVKQIEGAEESSSLQISEAEPFLGFANDVNVNDKQNVYEKTEKSDESKVPETIKSKDVFEDSSIELTELSKPFYGFSNVVANDEEKESSFVFTVTKKSNPLLDFSKIETKNENYLENDDISCISSEDGHSQESPERESLYDTCNSEQSSQNEDEVVTKEPIVAIEKMNLSLFEEYYTKMPNYDESCSLEISESDKSSNEYASMESNDIQDSSESSSNADNDSTYNEEDMESNVDETENDESMLNDKSSNEEECISFVTTRRRHEIGRKSDSILVLDESIASSSSGCDKTVLSNHKMDAQENYDDVNSTLHDIENLDDIPEANNKESINTEPRISFVTTRKSTKLSKERILPKTREFFETDRPGIVLQPGKKWERSLSIYRRLTTMTDHFDRSLLEDEDLNAKGRRYRQSVINTIELQETIGSISNESINSRRSTFFSKPSRSTIRIVKEPSTRLTLSNTTIFDDLKGFLEDCDDTVVELSKLSIAESDRDITVLEKIHDARVTTARDYVLRRCNQKDTILFDECYPDTLLKNCQKIGEGVYGEVYLYRGTDGRPRVMKIVPIAGTVKVNGEHQKDFDEVISEIVIAMELSALRAPIAEIDRHFDEGRDVDTLNLQDVENATDVFNEVLAVKCVYGNYPSLLLDRWDLYDETKGSENDNPAILPPDQQYIVLELANAGKDLESFQFNNAEQAYALFYQVAYGLAVAEEAYQFEHRDLHWGNVLIAPTDQKYATFVLRGRAHRVPRCGVAASIIDYSLSRISLPLSAGAGGGDAAALYNDLAADDGLFGALGDYQFEVYRLMRDKLGNDWKNYEPYTNILWLHYVVDKMITALRYKRTNTKTHKQYIAKLKEIKERILNYGSATLFVLT